MPSFREQVLSLASKIPRGKVTTYKILARKISKKESYRAVGQVLGKNPDLIKVPCHRVVMSNREIGGYAMGVSKKKELLIKEGIEIKKGRVVNFSKVLFKFQ